MKKQLFILPVLVFFVFTSYAQPVLTMANVAPQAGDTFLIQYSDTTIAPGPSGANVTWDFSGVEPTTAPRKRIFLLPSSTPYAATYPMADLGERQNVTQYNYYISNSDSLTLCGEILAGTRYYTDYKIVIPFPFAYTNTKTDTYTRNYTFSGTAYSQTGTENITADGYGTLILPGGIAFNDVLRIKTETHLVTVSPTPDTIDFTQYYWYKPGTGHWLFKNSGAFVYYLDPGFVNGITTPPANRQNTTLYPNPVKQGNNVEITWTDAENCLVTVIDLSGKVLISQEMASSNGVLKLNTLGLPAGMYTVNVKGTVETSGRLVVME